MDEMAQKAMRRLRDDQAFFAPRRRCCGCFALRTGVLAFAAIFGALTVAAALFAVAGPGYRFKTGRSLAIFLAVSLPQLLSHLLGLLAAYRRMPRLARAYHYCWVLLIFWHPVDFVLSFSNWLHDRQYYFITYRQQSPFATLDVAVACAKMAVALIGPYALFIAWSFAELMDREGKAAVTHRGRAVTPVSKYRLQSTTLPDLDDLDLLRATDPLLRHERTLRQRLKGVVDTMNTAEFVSREAGERRDYELAKQDAAAAKAAGETHDETAAAAAAGGGLTDSGADDDPDALDDDVEPRSSAASLPPPRSRFTSTTRRERSAAAGAAAVSSPGTGVPPNNMVG